jgi:hypothetical protein
MWNVCLGINHLRAAGSSPSSPVEKLEGLPDLKVESKPVTGFED